MSRPLLLSLALASLSSCLFVAPDDPQPVPARSELSGFLVVDWTIDATTQPNACAQGDASWLRLSVFTRSGLHMGDFAEDCGAFTTRVQLSPGVYFAEAVLEDADGLPRTAVVTLDQFTIVGNDTLAIAIEFRPSSFR
jgi:hypothetical protein